MRTPYPLWFPVALLAAALLVSALAARTGHAQVAAPRLDPLAVEGDAAVNPATLSWHGTFVGAGALKVKIEDKPAGGTLQEASSGDGPLVVGRWVGEMFALGGEAFDVKTDAPDGLTEFEVESSWIGGAGQYGDVVSLGVAQQDFTLTQTDTVTGDVGTQESDLPLVGLTVRLAEVFYIGAAGGTETVTETFQSGGASISREGDRGVRRLGVAYHMRDGDSGLHAEISREEKDELLDALTGLNQPSTETNHVVVEVVWSNILVAVERIETDESDAVTGDLIGQTEENGIRIGWVPMEGFNLVAGISQDKDTNPFDDAEERTEVVGLSAGWSF